MSPYCKAPPESVHEKKTWHYGHQRRAVEEHILCNVLWIISAEAVLTVAVHVHCIKLPLVMHDQHISASVHQLCHTASFDNVLLLSNEVGGRQV